MNSGVGLGVSGSPLGDRYTVVRELGRGGFGQTYLAKDRHRYDELCVVKEFVPQIEDKSTLDKAKELFEREASVLYQLGHRQIPEFRQLLEVQSETGGRLFIVQDYVEGPTYQTLLQERQRFGGHFSETEITQLLYQLLPVLSYIHGLGLVHRDISPDNLILRQSDGLPVLIDFGSVKEIAASVRSQLAIEGSAPGHTRIGKVGYVPPEQLSTGEANPASDLYSLAATLLVLATGKDPQVLNDPYHGGNWGGTEALSPQLSAILTRMLAPSPSDRFPSAEAVLAALKSAENLTGEMAGTPSESIYGSDGFYPIGFTPADRLSAESGDEGTLGYGDEPMGAIAGNELETEAERELAAASDVYEPVGREVRTIGKPEAWQAILGLLALLGLLGSLLFLALPRLRDENASSANRKLIESTSQSGDQEAAQIEGSSSVEETARRREIETRRQELGISQEYFDRLVEQLFYQRYPVLRTSGPNGGRKPVTDAPEDEPLRIRRDHIALSLLETLAGNNLQQESFTTLGSYNDESRRRWQSQIREVNVGMRALDDLVDAKFFYLFPEQAGNDFLTQPVGQVYYALADTVSRDIVSGSVREEVQFPAGSYRQDLSGQLDPGEGKIYTLQLSAGQLLRLNLSAPAESTQLSLYVPEPTNENPAIFADSEQTTWSGSLTQTGFYEIVVVNRSREAISYDLAISVDNVSVAPTAPPKPDSPKPEESSANSSPSPQSSSGQSNSGQSSSGNTDSAERDSSNNSSSAAGNSEMSN